MNKSELTTTLHKQLDLPMSKVEEIVEAFFELMSRTLINGDRIEIRGFGSLEVREYPGYTGRNPKTGALITVTDKKLPFFKAGKELRDRVDQA